MDLILDFTHTYAGDWIRAHKEMAYIDCTNLRGTDMYCSPDSVTELEKRITGYPLRGIHFIDSGNYHYMTRLFTKRIQKPYNLVFFDNHTDCKPSLIPELLSCGAWAKKVLEEDEFLQKMILIGPKQEAIDEIAVENRDKLLTVSREELESVFAGECTEHFAQQSEAGAGGTDIRSSERKGQPYRLLQSKIPAETLAHPLYISIDKDVLGREYAITNWDQGEMDLAMLKECLRFFFETAGNAGSESKREILGVDICGELPEKEAAFTEAAQAAVVNRRTNEELYEFMKRINSL